MASHESDEVVFERVARRARARLVRLVPATEFRGAYYRCSECSWTWDEDAAEKHSGDCVLAPHGLGAGHEYKPVDGERE